MNSRPGIIREDGNERGPPVDDVRSLSADAKGET